MVGESEGTGSMKKGEYTPGPWTARPYNVVSGRVAEWSIGSKEWKDLAHVYVQDDDTATECELGDGDANARLIAAAPDLLAACEAFREGTECMCCGGFPWCLHDRDKPHHLADALLAAIKKARGEK